MLQWPKEGNGGREGGRRDATETTQTWVAERMPGGQAARQIEQPSRGSQRALIRLTSASGEGGWGGGGDGVKRKI